MNDSERGTTGDRPAMFVFAHQDDEIAYLGLMRQLTGSGRRVNVVWITDGAYSVPAEVRRLESGANMSGLGLGDDRLDFWEYPDGRSLGFITEIVERLTARMREAGPAEVYTVAYEGGHPDHDLAHFAAVTAAGRQVPPPPVYEAPLYNRYGARYGAFNRFIPAESETLYTRLSVSDLLFKLRAIFAYRSQLWITVVPIVLFAGRRVFGPGEPYRLAPEWNYRQPPHEGKLFYDGLLLRRLLGIRFSDFRDAVDLVG